MSLPVPIPKTLQHLRQGLSITPGAVQQFSAIGLNEVHFNMPFPGMLTVHFDAVDTGSLMAEGETLLLPRRVERVGDTLWVEGNNLSRFTQRHHRRNPHRVRMELHIPADTHLNLSFFGGAIMLNGGTGKLTIRGKFGEVAGVSHSPDVRIDLRTGEVALNELPGKTDIELAYGSVKLGWSKLSGAEHARIHCALGGIKLLLPPGTPKVKERGGFFVNRRITTAEGAEIHATVGIGGVEAKKWGKKHKLQEIADAVEGWIKEA